MPPHQASFFSAATNMLKAARMARLSVLERFGRLARRKQVANVIMNGLSLIRLRHGTCFAQFFCAFGRTRYGAR
jgi:hypothetical protein